MNLERMFLAAAASAIVSVAPGLAQAASPRPSPQSTETPSATPSSVPAASAEPQPAASQRITRYTLPSDRYEKAHNLAKIHFRFALISFLYGLLVLWLILRWKLSAKYRTLAENKFSKRFSKPSSFLP